MTVQSQPHCGRTTPDGPPLGEVSRSEPGIATPLVSPIVTRGPIANRSALRILRWRVEIGNSNAALVDDSLVEVSPVDQVGQCLSEFNSTCSVVCESA